MCSSLGTVSSRLRHHEAEEEGGEEGSGPQLLRLPLGSGTGADIWENGNLTDRYGLWEKKALEK